MWDCLLRTIFQIVLLASLNYTCFQGINNFLFELLSCIIHTINFENNTNIQENDTPKEIILSNSYGTKLIILQVSI